MTEQTNRADYTKPHRFDECLDRDTVGSCCPDGLHCKCGLPYDNPKHETAQDAGGLL